MGQGCINDDPWHAVTERAFFIGALSLLAYYSPLWITMLVVGPFALKIYTKLTCGRCKSIGRIDGKTAIVTGANVGIGLETAKDLARRGGRIILACRNLEKGNAALDEVQRETGSTNIVLKHLDLSSLESVRKFCKEIIAEESRLDILVNNAGIGVGNKEMTQDKLELCMQTNHFAPFLLTNLLLDLMSKSENARVVNVTSWLHMAVRKFDLDNLKSEKLFFGFHAYNASKLCNIYFTTELNRRLAAAGIKNITVNSVHPGGVRTNFLASTNGMWNYKLFNTIMTFFWKSAEEGAQTSIYAAVSEEVERISGKYFDDCKEAPPSLLAGNAKNARNLWNKSVDAVQLKESETIIK